MNLCIRYTYIRDIEIVKRLLAGVRLLLSHRLRRRGGCRLLGSSIRDIRSTGLVKGVRMLGSNWRRWGGGWGRFRFR